MIKRIALIVAALALAAAGLAGPAVAQSPTCADVDALAIEVHGHHVVRDYVIGGALEWPPAGQVGSAIKGRGANPETRPGGPGPGFHFEHGFAPGASFCLSQSNSPGFHVQH